MLGNSNYITYFISFAKKMMNFSIFPLHNYLSFNIIRDRIKLAVALDRPFVDELGISTGP